MVRFLDKRECVTGRDKRGEESRQEDDRTAIPGRREQK